MDFVPYPNIHKDPKAYDKIFRKREFNKARYGSDFKHSATEDLCRRGEFRMQPHQEFVRNFLSPETPYNGILLFHGTGVGKTCAAIGITEGLRDHVHKNGKKIYILSSENIRPNFYKELYDPGRAAVETEMHSIPGSYQCAGDRYYVDGPMRPEVRLKAVRNLIKEYYEFYGFSQFANFVDIGLGADIPLDPETGRPKRRPKIPDVDIGEYFSGSVIVIDEAHGVAGEDKRGIRKLAVEENDPAGPEGAQAPEMEDGEGLADDDDDGDLSMIGKAGAERILSKRSLLRVLLDTIIPSVRARGGTLKIILMTATPMKDNQTELADLLELLNANDGAKLVPGWRKRLYPEENNYDPDVLRQLARGYVSYVKSNNPISFPRMLLPPAPDIYEPRPVFDYVDGQTDVSDQFEVFLDAEERHPFMFNLVNCKMSRYQLASYLNLRKRIIDGELRDPSDTYSRMLSNIAYPGSKTYGNDGFTACFGRPRALEEPREEPAPGERRQRWKVYGYTERAWREAGPFLMLENPINADSNLANYSQKFAKFIEYVNKSPGIVYAYSEFVQSGALLAALVLEANGYVHYSPSLEHGINKATGLPRPDTARTHLFMLSQAQRQALGRAGVDVDTMYRCARCGDWYQDHRRMGHTCPGFVVATYILVTGEHGGIKDIEYVNTRENIRGEKIKVVLGTKVTGQGVDFHWIRQVHILDPWHNNTRIYQAIGRGIRHCSHAELLPDERNVVVYKYASSTGYENERDGPNVPDSIEEGVGHTYRELMTETVDEHMYRRIIGKDIMVKSIERVLKEMAVDCELNKERNIFASDVDYSRECDYTVCNYRCGGYANSIEYIPIIIWKTSDNRWFVSDDSGNKNMIEKLIDSRLIQRGLQLLKTTEKQLKSMSVPNAGASNLAVWRFFRRHVLKLLNIEGFQYVSFRNSIELRKTGDKKFSLADKPLEDNAEVAASIISSTGLHIPKRASVNALWAWLIANPDDSNYQVGEVPGEEILELRIPDTDIDSSTYDIYFSAPHVSAAEKIISRIFQSSVALRLERILYMVHLANATINDEFVYMALDKLVGNPPHIKPRILTDRFGRKGYIIFRDGFYLFQPIELIDESIPMEYRRQPLRVKPAFYSMNVLEHGAAADKRAQLQERVVDDTSMEATLASMEKALRGESTKAGMGRGIIFNIIAVRQIIDSLLLTEMAYLVEKLLLEEPGPDISLATILVEYLVSKGLAYFVSPDERSKKDQPIPVLLRSREYTFFHILKKDAIRYLLDKKWGEMRHDELETRQKWNDMIQRLFSGAIKYVPLVNLGRDMSITLHNVLNNDYRNPKAVCGFLARAQTVRNTVRPERDIEALKKVVNFYREYPAKESLKEAKFKVISQSGSEGKSRTKAGAVSSRTILRGIVCMTMKPVQRDSAIENAEEALGAALGKMPADNEIVKSIAEYLDIMPNDQSASKCRRLETLLRVLDYFNIKDVRWFLAPFDTEYYMPAVVKEAGKAGI